MAERSALTEGLANVEASSGKSNFVYYSIADTEGPANTAIFFPGDRVEPDGDPVIARLSSPAGICSALARKSQGTTNCFILYPSHYEGPFACYQSMFNEMTVIGEPLALRGSKPVALQQISSLVFRTLKLSAVGTEADQPLLGNTFLFGFSKGGVVLNQVLSEISCLYAQADSSEASTSDSFDTFVESIRELHYLDVGLQCRGAYMTDPQVLNLVCKYSSVHSLRLGFHGTPRQWNDSRRPWISQEKDRCIRLLKEAIASLDRSGSGEGRKLGLVERCYFSGMRPSMAMHFAILDDFEV